MSNGDELPVVEVELGESRNAHVPAVIAAAFGGSRSEARRLLYQGAVTLDDEPVSTLDLPAAKLNGRVLRVRHLAVQIERDPPGHRSPRPGG